MASSPQRVLMWARRVDQRWFSRGSTPTISRIGRFAGSVPGRSATSPSQARAALESFQRAFQTGDLQGLLDVLAPEVVLVADGGGVKQAALRPIVGAEKVVRMIVGGFGRIEGTLTAEPTVVNCNPALLLRLDGELDGVMAIRLEDARITGLYYVRNPEKLARVESETPLTLR